MHESLTEQSKVQVINTRVLGEDEVIFTGNCMKQVPFIDFAGLDIARDINGKLWLMEVNRSPGFAKYFGQTGVNLANTLYDNK